MLRIIMIGAMGLCWLCAPALAADPPKTFEQIIKLKELGFSDDEVIAVAERSATVLTLTDSQVQQLKSAGAGDALIRALRPKAKKLTAQDVAQMARDKKPIEQIVDALAASESRPTVTADEAAALVEQGVEVPVLLLLRGKPLGINELKALAKAKASEAGCRKLIEFLGMQPKPVEPDEALALVEAGLARDVVALARKRADEAVKALREKEKDKEPVEDTKHPKELIGNWDGTMGSGNFIQQAKMAFGADGRYVFIAGAGHMEVKQTGTWFVANGVITFEVDNGRSESHQFDMAGNKLKIKSGGGSIDLVRQK